MILDAIQENCLSMRNAPAHLLGLNGIKKFSKEVLKWKNFDLEKRKRSGSTNYFMIHADGGTGGGIFRSMYGDFLIEAADVTGLENLKDIGVRFLAVADQWDTVADAMWALSETGDTDLLAGISVKVEDIHTQETELFQELLDLKRPQHL